LLGLTEKYIYDLQAKHEASRGQLPTNQIAEKTVLNLISQDRQAHGRKDVMIRWAMTMIARALWEIVRKKFTDAAWVLVTDSKPGDEDYVPINFIINEQEYQALLYQMMDVDAEEIELMDQVTRAEFEKQALAYKKQFEKENEVRKEVVESFVINDEVFSAEQIDQAMRKENLDPKQFDEKYQPEHREDLVYVINDLTREAELDVIFDIDFNYEADKQNRQNLAFSLGQAGYITGERVLKQIDFPDAEAAWREAVSMNQALQVGEAVVADQMLYQQVMAALQGMKPEKSEAKKTPAKGKSK